MKMKTKPRFTIHKGDALTFLYDNGSAILTEATTNEAGVKHLKNACALLNSLHSENERLKEQVAQQAQEWKAEVDQYRAQLSQPPAESKLLPFDLEKALSGHPVVAVYDCDTKQYAATEFKKYGRYFAFILDGASAPQVFEIGNSSHKNSDPDLCFTLCMKAEPEEMVTMYANLYFRYSDRIEKKYTLDNTLFATKEEAEKDVIPGSNYAGTYPIHLPAKHFKHNER
jgi:hypothetical protein